MEALLYVSLALSNYSGRLSEVSGGPHHLDNEEAEIRESAATAGKVSMPDGSTTSCCVNTRFAALFRILPLRFGSLKPGGAAPGCRSPDKRLSQPWLQTYSGKPSGTPPRTCYFLRLRFVSSDCAGSVFSGAGPDLNQLSKSPRPISENMLLLLLTPWKAGLIKPRLSHP